MATFRARVWFEGRVSFRLQDNGQNGHFGCPLGSIWAFWDLNKIIAPNYIHGSGRIYVGRAWYQGPTFLVFCFHDNGQKGYFGCPLGSIWASWDLNKIRTLENYFCGSGMPHLWGYGMF